MNQVLLPPSCLVELRWAETTNQVLDKRGSLKTMISFKAVFRLVSAHTTPLSVYFYLVVCVWVWPTPDHESSAAAWPSGPVGIPSPSAAAPPATCTNTNICYAHTQTDQPQTANVFQSYLFVTFQYFFLLNTKPKAVVFLRARVVVWFLQITKYLTPLPLY